MSFPSTGVAAAVSRLPLQVLAPLSGVIVPLSAVPDPVFAEGMAGEGASIDPTSQELLAPVAGVITQLHPSNHALTLTTECGFEILTHIGVDTVQLRGDGFKLLVRLGDKVAAGTPLIRFDLDRVASQARSLLTQVLVANVEHIAALRTRSGLVEAGKSVLFELEAVATSPHVANAAAPTGETVESAAVTLRNALGLHARPAAVLAAQAKAFAAEIKLVRGEQTANAKSMVSILSLSTRFGDVVKVRATGADAAAAVTSLERLLREGSGEALAEAPAATPVAAIKDRSKASALPGQFSGAVASPGLALGTLVQLKSDDFEIAPNATDADAERVRLLRAVKQADEQLAVFCAGEEEQAKIISAHRELLQDPEILEQAMQGIQAKQSAAFAWRAAFHAQASVLEGLPNPALRERAVDVRDVGKRVLRLLVNVAPKKLQLPAEAIVIAEELTPSDFAELDASRVIGLCMVHGGATGHVAILARALGVPALCGLDVAVLGLKDGGTVILDTEFGVLSHQPGEAELIKTRQKLTALRACQQEEAAAAQAPALTTDGVRFEIAANVRNADDIRKARALGADGVGLLRSEFLFEGRATAPTEEEQFSAYRSAVEALGPELPLVIRSLDVGGDKPLPYLPLPKEENPFLGLRGIRVSLLKPELFRVQLRSILRVAPLGNLHLMFPMVATLSELRAAKVILQEEMKATGQSVKLGLMIEVPSAALLAETFAPEVDFFSIGTNDLTQYTLAMDRGHARLAKQADTLEPAVLKLIELTVKGAHQHGKWVGVCGGVASDPVAIPLLLGLGIDELSVSPPSIPAVKAQVRRLSAEACRRAAVTALGLSGADDVRAFVKTTFSV